MSKVSNCSPLAASLAWCEGRPVLPGLRRRVYFIHKSQITKWPTLPKDEYGRPTAATYVGSFELASGAKFHYIDLLVNNSGHTSEPQGEVPSQTQLNKFVGVHPGTREEATLFAAMVNNSDLVLIPQDADGKYRVIGNEMYQTKATVGQDSGQGPTGTASTTINAECTDLIPAPFYNGEIDTEEGIINPQETGSGSGSGSGSPAGSGTGSGSDSGSGSGSQSGAE